MSESHTAITIISKGDAWNIYFKLLALAENVAQKDEQLIGSCLSLRLFLTNIKFARVLATLVLS